MQSQRNDQMETPHKMDLADKGLLMHLLGNYKHSIESQIAAHSGIHNDSKELARLKMELEMIECANDIIQDIP